MNEEELPTATAVPSQFTDCTSENANQQAWTAMVDSVIEFIAASRTMLNILNDRLVGAVDIKELEENEKQDMQMKERFYQEFLNMNRVSKCSKLVSTSSTGTETLCQRKHIVSPKMCHRVQNYISARHSTPISGSKPTAEVCETSNKAVNRRRTSKPRERKQEETAQDDKLVFAEGENVKSEPPLQKKEKSYCSLYKKVSPKGDIKL